MIFSCNFELKSQFLLKTMNSVKHNVSRDPSLKLWTEKQNKQEFLQWIPWNFLQQLTSIFPLKSSTGISEVKSIMYHWNHELNTTDRGRWASSDPSFRADRDGTDTYGFLLYHRGPFNASRSVLGTNKLTNSSLNRLKTRWLGEGGEVTKG